MITEDDLILRQQVVELYLKGVSISDIVQIINTKTTICIWRRSTLVTHGKSLVKYLFMSILVQLLLQYSNIKCVLIVKFVGGRNILIMDIVELRRDLHNMIDKISDSNVLNAVKTLLSGKTATQSDWWDTISDEEKAEIEQGLAEADRGEVIPHEEVMKKYEKWL
jgi:predicted transcriptional regulator